MVDDEREEVVTVAERTDAATGKAAEFGRRNYWSFVSEGALFNGAMNLVSSTTLLPKMIQSYGGPTWLIAAIPIIGPIGFLLPPILNAHHVEHLRRYKPFAAWCCLMQRLPYAVAALVLLCLPGWVAAALLATALAPLISGVFGGVGLTTWQQLFTKCVPRERRQAVIAVRSTVSGGLGVLAGYVVAWVLTTWPGTTGFGVLHAFTFAVLMASFGTFMFLREPAAENPVPATKNDLFTHLSTVPTEVLADRNFVLLLLTRFFRNGLFIIAPFLAIHCQAMLGQPASFLGKLLTVQMVGTLVGNAVAAGIGARRGSKVTLMCGLVVFSMMSMAAMVAATVNQWLAIFVLFGAGSSLCEVGGMTLGLEMGRRERRATFLAVGALINLPAMLIASSLSYWLHDRFWTLALATLISVVLAIAFLVPLKEPHEQTGCRGELNTC